ncbi:hypothetical protein EPN96_04250 [bacterium]|nr:MAG: hypothetical protein EPN96_04250 [bacterium]
MVPERIPRASFRRAGGYLLGRAIVLTALIPLVSVYAINQGRVLDAALLWFILLTAVSFGFTLLTAVSIHRGYCNENLLKAQPLWDVLYSTGLVFLSGGLSSPVVFIYPLIIIGAAMLFYRPGAFGAATWSSLAYGFVGIVQVYRLAAPASPIHGIEISGLSLPFRMTFHIVSFYAVAILSGFLAEELRRADKRLEEARTEILDLENIQLAILHSMGGGLAAFDPKGRLMFCNEHGRKMLLGAGVDAGDAGAMGSIFDLEKTGREEASLGGGKSFFGYNVAPLVGRDGQRIGKILSFQDLTEIHRLEQRLKQSDRLAAVGRLAAGLAHEIRNPLASLSGSVQILSGNLCPEGGTEKQLITIVLRETERLNKLVTGFLRYARPQEAVREEFDFCRLVDEVALFFRQGEGRDNFILVNRIEKGEKFYGNREAMEQLLLNLFCNSAEASQGKVTVTVEGGAGNGGFELTVSDDGPGIPREIADRIFEPFVSGKSSGTGLGLALVHRIVENHGGTVSLETVSPDGAVFFFRFGR